MKTKNQTIFVIIFGLAVVSACIGQPRYTSIAIQTPPGFSSAALSWISDDGKTGFGSGWNNALGATACFLYQNGSYTSFSTPSSGCGIVRAGNTRGEFVGTLSPPLQAGFGSVPEDAFVYRNGDFMRLDSLLPGQPPVSFATSINENGDVAGVFQTNFYTFTSTLRDGTTSLTSSPAQQFAFVYSNGLVRQLPDLGAQWSTAYAINDNGDVVGDSVLPSDLGPPPVHAAIFPHDGGIIDLGTFGGPRSSAVAINSKGQVAGWANLDANNSHAFFYDSGMMTEIQLPGGNAASINDGGEVVGTYRPASDQSQHAFYYANGNAADLNTLTLDLPAGMILVTAQRITNEGLILVSAQKSPSEPVTQFLLTPVSGS
jgi:probable HAF family extracellular repeat protein